MDANDYIDGIHWYVVHTYSGYENKVKTSLEKIVANRSLQELIYDVQIPTRKEISGEGEDAKEVEQKIYPSYVMIKMIMNDFTWHIIRNITGVTGFVGPGSNPTPLTDAEVAALGVETVLAPTLAYGVGDSVTIKSGPFQGYIGKVEEISPDQKTIRILASIFGRETPVEIESKNAELLKI
jgi:transcriptional antiterminator NusG